MKLKAVFLSLALMIPPASAPWRAQAGQETGNGGDYLSEQFLAELRWEVLGGSLIPLYRDLGQLPSELTGYRYAILNLMDWSSRASPRVTITSEPLFVMKGDERIEVDAKNFFDEEGRARIIFHFERWKALTPCEQAKLVNHEFLGLLGLEGTGHQALTDQLEPYIEACVSRRQAYTSPRVEEALILAENTSARRDAQVRRFCRGQGFESAFTYSTELRTLSPGERVVTGPYSGEWNFSRVGLSGSRPEVYASITCNRW